MALRVYNTLSRQKEDFQTVVPGKVGMYLCGPTVYKPSHIGHMVGPVIFDTVKRYLVYLGYEVKFIINITDVDDKLIVRAAETGSTVSEIAREMTIEYKENLKTFGVESVDDFPLATEHIGEMQEIILRLIDKGFAYILNGDVYFDVAKDPKYGSLSNRNLADVIAGTRVEANEQKRHPADFALWKKSKPGEPAWESPWGKGRPGWHIECSAMSAKHLGETFDIHGGGLDLLFPHHENERAQSECCSGKTFARYWLHNGLMQAGRQSGKLGGGHDRHGDLSGDLDAQTAGKISKSTGAGSVRDLFRSHSPETIRFFLLSTHYRSPIEFSDEALTDCGRTLDGFYRLFEAVRRATGVNAYELPVAARRDATASLSGDPADYFAELTSLRDRFFDAMDDDFNTGAAVGVLFELRRAVNAFIHSRGLDSAGTADETSRKALLAGVTLLRELAGVLGVFTKPPGGDGLADDGFAAGLMDLILELRKELRAARNWGLADRIRDRMKELKVVIEDRKDGVVWRRER